VYLKMVEEEEDSEESESEESGEIGQGETLELEWDSQSPSDSANKRSEQQHCGRWMREEGGRRRLITNYEDVLQALREL